MKSQATFAELVKRAQATKSDNSDNKEPSRMTALTASAVKQASGGHHDNGHEWYLRWSKRF